MVTYLLLAAPLLLVYLALTGNIALNNIILGAILALAMVALMRPKLPPTGRRWRHLPGALIAAFLYLLLLLVDLIRSGLQVAWIVVHPSLPIQPGLVVIKSGGQSELAVALAAHAISVTPGELVVEIDEDGNMLTHCLDARHAARHANMMQARRHQLLRRIFV